METQNSDLQHSHALTTFLVIDYLQKEGVSPLLLDKLSGELSEKGRFKSMITLQGKPQHASFNDLKSQFPAPKTPFLRNMVHQQYQKQKECLLIKQKKDTIIRRIKEENDIFDVRKRRDVLSRRSSLRSLKVSREAPDQFPPEIFTEYWGKFKTFFGHMKKEIDPEDPLNGSPVYNLIYDKGGRFVITAADDGIIKIWSTTNGELLNTIIGHNSDINDTSLSECGNYLASCSNESLVKIWHLETGFPVAVFNDHRGSICSLNFFSIPTSSTPGANQVKGLVTAADDGTIIVYFEQDYINNDGLYKPNQKKLKFKSDDAVTGFCSIEVHPEGYITAGTSGGSIVIWNKITEIDARRIERHRIIKTEHSKDCHLTVWSKQGTKLLSASFDGTAKIWLWNKENFESNRNMKSLCTLESELGKGIDLKCCAVAWSCKGRYAIASFCKKLSRSTDDNEVIRGNIQVYDLSINKRTHKFENSFDKVPFENYIFILEAHPFNESIVMSADYDGKIIIWDIEHGYMLNAFVEDCSHLGFPLCQAPVLDGKFSPDGLSFCVTNYHGSFSIYGYGEKDLFLTTPTEQFFMKEFGDYDFDPATFQVMSLDYGADSHFVEKGPLCSSKKKVYTEDFTEHNYYQTFDETRRYQRYLKAIQRKKNESKPTQEGFTTENCLKALKERVREDIQQKTNKALEELYFELSERKSENLAAGLKLTRKQIRKLLKPTDDMSLETDDDKIDWQSQEDKPRKLGNISNRRIIENDIHDLGNPFGDKEDLEEKKRPMSDEQEYKEEQENLQPARRRRVRKILLDSAQDLGEEDIQMQSPKSLKEESIEEKGQHRKHRRLVLDDEESQEEILQSKDIKFDDFNKGKQNKMEEIFDSTEDKPEESGIALVRTESREITGRRNRQLASNSSNVRQAAATTRSVRASRARNLQQIQPQETIQEVMCARCGLENARIKCNNDCGRAYHSACSKRQGRDNERGIFTCFSCLYKSRRKEKPNGAKVIRTWAEKDFPEKNYFMPQVGDYVTYIFQGHEEFILHYFDFLRFSKGEVFPCEKYKGLLQDNICKIADISYQFPLAPRWYKGQLSILMKITLETVESGSLSGNTFKVSFFQAEFCDFIMPRDLYVVTVQNALQLTPEQEVSFYYGGQIKQGYLAEVSPREEGPFPSSHWKSLKVTNRLEGEAHANKKSKKEAEDFNLYISPWEVFWGDISFVFKRDEDITREFTERVIREIQRLYENNTDKFEIFLEEVDKDAYRDYPQVVPFEMNIEKIKKRLGNLFYRHKEAMVADTRLIMLNCHEYNEPTSQISIWSRELTDKMIFILNPSAKTQPAREQSAKRQELNKRRAHAQEEARGSAPISRGNMNQEFQNERQLPRIRTRRLILQDDQDEQPQENQKALSFLHKENKNYSEDNFRNQRATEPRNEQPVEQKSRLKRGLRIEENEEEGANHQSENTLRVEVKRKEISHLEKLKGNDENPNGRAFEGKKMDFQLAPAVLGLQKPQEDYSNALNNQKLQQNEDSNYSLFFGVDSEQQDIEINLAEGQDEKTQQNVEFNEHSEIPNIEDVPINYSDINMNDDFHGFFYGNTEPSHQEFLNQHLIYQGSNSIPQQHEKQEQNEYEVEYNADYSENEEDKRLFDDDYFMDATVEVLPDRRSPGENPEALPEIDEESQFEENMPQETEPVPSVSNTKNNYIEPEVNWDLNAKRSTYDRRFSEDEDSFGSLFGSESNDSESPKRSFRNKNEDESQAKPNLGLFRGNGDEDSNSNRSPKRQISKNKRLKI